MSDIKIKQPFKALDLSAGVPVTSEAFNQIEGRPEGRYAVQYSKSIGGGKLNIAYEVSVNGDEFFALTDAYPVVEESVSAAAGLGELRPPMAPYIRLIAEAVDGNIDNLNVWVAIQ